MSRIGKKIRKIPQGVTVDLNDGVIVVKGPKGELRENIHPNVTMVVKDGEVSFSVVNEANKKNRALWGTFSSLVNNMIVGVSEGFKKQLEVNGVGYRVGLKGKDLELSLGFSHPVVYKADSGITFTVDKNVITIEGINRQQVGEVAAQIRSLRKPEPYKGKGIKYMDEVIRRKAGKTASKGA